RAARDFGRRRHDVTLTILRFANFMGSQIETPLTRYFSLPVVPTPLGYDPRIQFVHEDDAVEVLYRAVREEHPGIFNVAGDGAVRASPPSAPTRWGGSCTRSVLVAGGPRGAREHGGPGDPDRARPRGRGPPPRPEGPAAPAMHRPHRVRALVPQPGQGERLLRG